MYAHRFAGHKLNTKVPGNYIGQLAHTYLVTYSWAILLRYKNPVFEFSF